MLNLYKSYIKPFYIFRKEAVKLTKVNKKSSDKTTRKIRPALNPEARENQMISLAVDLAEKQLIEGTASAQVITHYLKLGTMNHKLELEKLSKENELLKAKTETLQSAQRVEELYSNALEAMRNYSGHEEFKDD
jgi:hypothetical protein